MSLLLALSLAAAEPELPACVQRLSADLAACDSALAAEKDRRLQARLLLRRAYAENETHDYDAALRDLDAAVAADPAYGVAWHERSYTFSELREFARAVAASNEDVRLRPEAPDAYRERAFARHGLGDLNGAYEDRAKVVRLEPESAGARIALGRAALWLGRFDEARANTTAALSMAEKAGSSADAAEARAQLERIELWSARSSAAAGEPACRAAEKNGTLGRKEAIGDCTAAFLAAGNPHVKAEMLTLRSLAFLVAAQDQASAVEDEAMAVALEPQNAQWHANLGGSYVMAHHSWAGRRELDISIRLKDSWAARAQRAAARYNLRDFAGASEDAKASLRMEPNEVALIVLGDLARDGGDTGSAKRYWLQAWHLGSRDDGLRERLKQVGVADPDKEPGH